MQTKFRLSVRWLCFAVLLAAVVVRLAAHAGQRKNLKIWTKNIDKLLNRW